MWRSSSIRCLSRVIGETSCTDENIEIRQPAGLRVTRSAVPAPIEKLLRGRKSAQNAACGLVQRSVMAPHKPGRFPSKEIQRGKSELQSILSCKKRGSVLWPTL